jgi:hypothetical protein
MVADLFSDPLGFALEANMITLEEHRACLRGDMEVLKASFDNENSHGLRIRKVIRTNGNAVRYSPFVSLYTNRADDVLIAQILGDA